VIPVCRGSHCNKTAHALDELPFFQPFHNSGGSLVDFGSGGRRFALISQSLSSSFMPTPPPSHSTMVPVTLKTHNQGPSYWRRKM